MSEWISVKERLPKDYEHVLAWEDETCFIAYPTIYNVRWTVAFTEDCNGFTDTIEPTHWMPLPTPPAPPPAPPDPHSA